MLVFYGYSLSVLKGKSDALETISVNDKVLSSSVLKFDNFFFQGDVWKLMQRYGKEIRAASSVTVKLYPFILQLQNDYEDDTDDEQLARKDQDVATLRYNLEDDSESYKANTP